MFMDYIDLKHIYKLEEINIIMDGMDISKMWNSSMIKQLILKSWIASEMNTVINALLKEFVNHVTLDTI
mgnify:CR=1 FL=1